MPGTVAGQSDTSLWVLVNMAAVLGGTMRSPLTGAIFALELTHDVKVLPALLLASVIAYGFTVLVMRRSILTEKIARRGYHVSREYSVDPLERLSVADIMTAGVVTVPASLPVVDLLPGYFLSGEHKHQAYPVVDERGQLLGVITLRRPAGGLDLRRSQGGRRAGAGYGADHHLRPASPGADYGAAVGVVPHGGRAHGPLPGRPAAGGRA